MRTEPARPCPDGASLVIKGEHFPCRTMDDLAPECETHEGWAHSNRDAEAIWQINSKDVKHGPWDGIPANGRE